MSWDAAERYQLLLKVNNAIVNQNTRESLFRALADELAKHFTYDRLSINLFDQETRSLTYFATAVGVSLAGSGNAPRPMGKGVIAQMVIRTREPVIIPDLTRQNYISHPSEMLEAGLRATMAFPLIVRKSVLGSLHVSFRQAPSDMQDLAQLMAEISTQTAIAVDNMLSYTRLRMLNEQLQQQRNYLMNQAESGYSLDGFYFSSSAMTGIMSTVEMVAPTDAPVLITGETGTGKDHIARAIHKLSNRRGELLVKVNCPALSPSLFESELFGHAKGAFTGANNQRIGRFEMADGGTIFLDEIGDLEPVMQAKILHVLQDGAFERVGDSRTIKVDFRVIAATNKDLDQAMREGRFRPDLFYRLSTVHMQIPPLRERREDIPLLLRRLNEQIARETNRKEPEYLPPAMELLRTYSWPGNIRELRNVVSRMILLKPGGSVTPGDLESMLGATIPSEDGFPTLEHAERQHIERALRLTKGQIAGSSGAAALLGVPRSTLQYRLRKLGINAKRLM
ncbi:MAG: sigma 54-interacting transcriptional regulator [Desulfocurvibacter africanus]